MIHTVLSILKRLVSTAMLGFAILTLSLSHWTTPAANAGAIALPNPSMTEIAADLDGDRLKAIKDCLPEQLTIQNQDTGDRIARAFEELGNEQLERMFDLLDDPDLNQAEVKFEQCLQRNGYTPRRQQVSS